jgi:hypothetical protein
MSTDLETDARMTIEMIKAELDPNQIKGRFDDPIDKAAMEFDFEPACPISHKEFHQIVARFVREVHDRALAASWTLTDPLAKALSILENNYQSAVYGTSYVAALLDANDPAEGGIQTVLTNLTETIKDMERNHYTRSVFAWHLNGCSWKLRCEIARVLLKDYRAFIPERLGNCTPAQLVDAIPSLISMSMASDSILRQIAR